MYHDFLYFYSIDLIAVVAGETRYTPRILLSLIENLPEGAAFPAEHAGIPEKRFWTSIHELIAAVHNAQQINTMIQVDKKDRKSFEMIEPPWVKVERAKNTKSQVSPLLSDRLGTLDDLPLSLRSKPKE